MTNALRTTCLLLFGLAALPAQEPEGKKPPATKPKAEAQADKERQKEQEKLMRKDPAILALDKFLSRNKVDTKAPGWRQRLQAPPLVPFDDKTDYFWHLETSKGEVVVRLFPDTAPMHVTVGMYLSRLGFYDGLKFHRVIKGFMAQGGCPLGSGGGGPGFTIDGEFFGTRKHDKPGILSTANTGMPKTDGSQFFLTFVPTPHLDGKHTIWGEVVEGMEAVKGLEAAGTQRGTDMAEPPQIVRTWISLAKKDKAGDGADKGDTSGKGAKDDAADAGQDGKRDKGERGSKDAGSD